MFAMLLRVHFANVPNLTLWEWESSALIASADLLSLEALTAHPPHPSLTAASRSSAFNHTGFTTPALSLKKKQTQDSDV